MKNIKSARLCLITVLLCTNLSALYGASEKPQETIFTLLDEKKFPQIHQLIIDEPTSLLAKHPDYKTLPLFMVVDRVTSLAPDYFKEEDRKPILQSYAHLVDAMMQSPYLKKFIDEKGGISYNSALCLALFFYGELDKKISAGGKPTIIAHYHAQKAALEHIIIALIAAGADVRQCKQGAIKELCINIVERIASSLPEHEKKDDKTMLLRKDADLIYAILQSPYVTSFINATKNEDDDVTLLCYAISRYKQIQKKIFPTNPYLPSLELYEKRHYSILSVILEQLVSTLISAGARPQECEPNDQKIIAQIMARRRPRYNKAISEGTGSHAQQQPSIITDFTLGEPSEEEKKYTAERSRNIAPAPISHSKGSVESID